LASISLAKKSIPRRVGILGFLIVQPTNASHFFWKTAMYQPKAPITSAAEVKAILGPDIPSQIVKVIDHIDVHCKAWIWCPFIVISSDNAAGAAQPRQQQHNDVDQIQCQPGG
jgi:hypothetical protein